MGRCCCEKGIIVWFRQSLSHFVICTRAGVGVEGNIIIGTGRTNRIDGLNNAQVHSPRLKHINNNTLTRSPPIHGINTNPHRTTIHGTRGIVNIVKGKTVITIIVHSLDMIDLHSWIMFPGPLTTSTPNVKRCHDCCCQEQ